MAAIGRNKPCWCGSGKKTKRCHPEQARRRPLARHDLLKRFDRAFHKRECLHPHAGASTCKGKIVDAHTIQKRVLRRIAQDGHVYSTPAQRFSLKEGPSLIGVRDASVFTGFCQIHDDQLFAPLEKEPWQASRLQIALLGCRAICHEFYLKRAAVRAMDAIKAAVIDQDTKELSLFQFGASIAVKELGAVKRQYDELILRANLDSLSYYVVELEREPELVCSAAAQTTHDFRGFQIADFSDFDKQSDWMTFSLVATDRGGAVVFTWLEDQEGLNEHVMRTLDELSDVQLSHAAVRFAFEFCENSFFTPTWWDGLEPSVQASFRERHLRGLPPDWEHPPACLAEDWIRAVEWKITRRELSFGVGGQAFDLVDKADG